MSATAGSRVAVLAFLPARRTPALWEFWLESAPIAATFYLLSNNHVLAAGNHVPVGMPILSPSPIDAGPATRAPGEVGRHAEICELRSGVPTLVVPGREDVALAHATDPAVVSSWRGAGPDSYDTPASVVAPRSGVEVKKFGRTTGLTYGTVEALINSPFPLPYKCRFFSATVWFHDVWTIRGSVDTPSFALPGDSGSLVVTRDGTAAVGIVFATSTPHGEVGFIVPLSHISTLFGGITLTRLRLRPTRHVDRTRRRNGVDHAAGGRGAPLICWPAPVDGGRNNDLSLGRMRREELRSSGQHGMRYTRSQ